MQVNRRATLLLPLALACLGLPAFAVDSRADIAAAKAAGLTLWRQVDGNVARVYLFESAQYYVLAARAHRYMLFCMDNLGEAKRLEAGELFMVRAPKSFGRPSVGFRGDELGVLFRDSLTSDDITSSLSEEPTEEELQREAARAEKVRRVRAALAKRVKQGVRYTTAF